MLKYLIERFEFYSKKVNGIGKFRLFLLYIFDYIRFGCTIKDFFNYKFYLLNTEGKKLYVTGGQLRRAAKRNNPDEYLHFMNDKEETFLKYSKWMQRMWCGVKYNNTLADYEAFVSKNKQCIVKPLKLSGGRGIRIIDIESTDAQKLMKDCIDNNEMIEQLIVQHEKMLALYPFSVNTIRIVTEDGKIVFAVLRMGSNGNVVDNACAGGMGALIDIETGIVTSDAVDYESKRYIKHPDTGMVIPGFEIPMWSECKALIEEAKDVLLQIPITGFDIAITDNGPVLVEVNESPDAALYQTLSTMKIDKRILKKA